MIRHRLVSISFLFTLWLFPAVSHAQGKFTGGSVTVDAGGAGDFMSLREAAENYNTYGITGHTTLLISSDLEETQTAQFGNAPGSGAYKLTITTDGTRRTVSGNINGPVIWLYGAHNITIDGIAQATASNLTGNKVAVRNTYTAESAAVGTIYVTADGTGKGSNIVIRNTEMSNAVGDTQGIANLLVSTDSIRVEGCFLHGANENLIAQNLRRLVFKNNVVTDSRKSGLSVTMYYPEQCVISGNMIDNITGSGNSNLQLQGIFLSSAGLGTLTIADNTIRNINNQMTGDAGAYGMVLSSDGYLNVNGNKISAIGNASNNPAHSAAGIFCILGELGANGGVADLKNNIIENITDRNFPFGIEIFSDKATARGFATGNTITGITASAGVDGNNAAGIAMNAPGIVSGNRISGIVAPVGSAKGLYGRHPLGDVTLVYNNFLSGIMGKAAAGIYIESGTGFKVYHNTIFLSGKNNDGDEATCVVLSTDAELHNNLLVNTAPGNASNNQAVVLQSASSVLSENRYHIANGVIGKTASNNGYGNINAWNAVTGDNSVRLQNVPAFVSAEDLHLSGTSTVDPLLHTALQADVPTDINRNARSSCSNAAGADNFSDNPAFSYGNFSARTVCAGLPSYIGFEVTGGVAPFRYGTDNGAQTNITADSITLSGNRAFSFNRVLNNGNHTIQVTDAGNCTFTTSQTLAINATGTNIWYVNQAVPVSGDGATPETAFKDLQNALENTCLKTNDTIKVATGTYLPSKPISGTGSRDNTFYITKSIHLKGAYNTAFTARDTALYRTVLSGDIGTPGDNSDNAHHVVSFSLGATGSGSIDGFTIRDGNANGGTTNLSGIIRNHGGGIYLYSGSLVIKNNIVKNNNATGMGGGIYAAVALNLENTTISNNTASSTGGGIHAVNTLTVTNSKITGNTAGTTGGGIHAITALTVNNSKIIGNTAGTTGGGLNVTATAVTSVNLNKVMIAGNKATGTGGGVFTSNVNITLSIFDSEIKDNISKVNGGGMYATGVLELEKTTVSGNKAGYDITTDVYSGNNSGGGVYAANALTLIGDVVFRNNMVSGGTAPQTIYGGGAIYKSGTADFTVSGLTSLKITGNRSVYGAGGGIYTAAVLNLKADSIKGNTARTNGGGICATAALSLTGVAISENKAGYDGADYAGNYFGGGVYAGNALTLIGDVVFRNNMVSGGAAASPQTSSGGGAIYKSGTADFTVSGLTSLKITGNRSVYGAGGGIYTAAVLNLKADSIKGNTARTNGGGICATAALSLTGVAISENKAGYDGADYAGNYFGGGVYANTNLELQGKVFFEENTASGSGGGIYKNGATAFDVSKLDELTVKGNAARGGTGGGIYTAAELDLSNLKQGDISNNTASGNGGGISTPASGTVFSLNISNAVINNNSSGGNGGGIYSFWPLKLNNTTVSGNKAGYTGAGYSTTAYSGGGIYSNNALTLAGNMVFENDTASGSGGAIFKSSTGTFDVSKLDELTVKENAALNGTGGGIHTASILDLSGVSIGNILNNVASGNGGGIYANLALSLGNSVVSGNKAGHKNGVYSGTSHGGGVFANNSLMLAGNMIFENDSASGNGGAIYKNGTTAFNVSGLTQLTVNNNAANYASASATDYIGGGGIWTGAPLDLSRVLAAEFKNNSSQGKGGAVCAGAATVELAFNNTVFSNNKSGYDFLSKGYTTTGFDHGGAVYANNNLVLKGNLNFDGNISGGSGGGIWKGATGNIDVTGLNELTVTKNEARGGDGGGISTMALSLELSGVNKVAINNNKASGDGGGIYMGKSEKTAFARLSLKNTTISNNKAGWNFAINDYGTDPYNGGGVYVNMAALMLSGSVTFENNGASGNGGAVWKKAIFKSSINYDDGPFDVTGLEILNVKDNKAGVSGGGIYTEAPLDFYNLKSGDISSNIAGQDGGGIHGSADMNMVNTRFSANTAGRYGGSIYAGGILETNQSIFTGNNAVLGGALYKAATGSMTVQKSTFTGNRADNGGAIISMLAAQTIFNSTFSGNTAVSNGGAICFATASTASNVITYCTFNNNRTDDNAANAIYYTNPNGSLKGNIIYGNGTGTEINNITGLTTQYNIVRNPAFSGTGDQNLAEGNGVNIFASSAGDVAAPAGNGGTTPTILIKTNGLAHNQIVFDVAATFGPLGATDQRGENRVTGFTDIGSVELAPQPCSGTPEPVVWYVDVAAAPGGDGTSIPGRANDLNIVLTNPCLKDGDTIKLAQGTYYSTNTGADKSFIVLKGITILGGYTSGFTETARNIVTQPTILDGKSLSYHVVIWNTGNNNTGTIDGVTIRNGKATGTTPFIFAQDNGGGILLNNGILTVSNSTVSDNTAVNKGGGIHVSANTSLTLKNLTSRNNKAGHNGNIFTTSRTGTSAVDLETRSGGGISALGKLELRGNMLFEYDMAGANGGGIFLGLQCAFVANQLDELTMTGCESKLTVPKIDNNIDGNFGGGGIFTTLGIDLSNVKKATFTNCFAAIQGGGIFVNDKTGKLTFLEVANATFTGCKATTNGISDGGAIESFYGTQSVIVVRNSTFKDCYAARYGGALGIGNALRLEGSVRIDNCTSDNNGGGISQWGLNGLPAMFDVSALDTLVVTNCKSNLGGGIWVQGAPLDFSNTKHVELTGNFSKTHGGAIYMSNVAGGVTPYTLTLRNAIISDNRAGWDGSNYTGTNNGGGINTTNLSPVIMKGNIILANNTANGNGGGIYVANTITGVGLDTLKITGNTAMTAAGGGMYATGAISLSELKSGEISGNVAKTNGGGIYAGNALTLTRTTLYDNQADEKGGGIYKASSNLTLTKSTLAKNRAATGGGVYTTAGTNTIANCTFSENSATSSGGGLYAANTVKVSFSFSSFNGNTANGGVGSGNAISFDSATAKTLYGNIIYGNGTSGAEISVAPATASYNIVRNMSLTGTGNVNLAAGLGNTVFKNVTGDLATLEDNGGPTKTLMIAEQNQGGLAHNFIPVNTAKTFDPPVTSDQRDSVRFAKCKSDCGSVEIQRDIATYAFKQPWARACPYTLIDADTLIAKTANIKDAIYYSDKNYTQLLAMPAKNVSRIYVKFTSLDGCVELRDTIKIDLVPMPSVKVIGGKTRTGCSNGSIDLNINTANAANIVWSGWERSGTSTGASTETLHFTPFQRTSDTTFYIKATAHSNSECLLTASDSVLLTVKGLFDAGEISSVGQTFCAGQAMPNTIGSLTGATGGDQTGGYTYRWLLNGTVIVNTNTAVYTPVVILPGTYIYTREAKDTRCNTDFVASTGMWTLTINALPAPTITGTATVCIGQSLTLSTEAYFARYAWTVAPAGNVTLAGGGTGNEETFTWSAVGTKNVTVTATDINGCVSSAITNIEVTPKADTGPIYRVPNR